MRHFFAFLCVSFVASGCYLSHERPEPVVPPLGDGGIWGLGDSSPPIHPDAGEPVPDSGPLMADAGSDAFIPTIDGGSTDEIITDCGLDVGTGAILVTTDDELWAANAYAIAVPGVRNLLEARALCNGSDEYVDFSELAVTHINQVRYYRNLTVEHDGNILGRIDGLDAAHPATTIPLSAPLRIPPHTRVHFVIRGEITGLRSWAAEPDPDAALHSGDNVNLSWAGGTVPGSTHGVYTGIATGETSGVSYQLLAPGDVAGWYYSPVRASRPEVTVSDAHTSVTASGNVVLMDFDQVAFGGRVGTRRFPFLVERMGDMDLSNVWLEIDGRHLADSEVTIEHSMYEGRDVYLCLLTYELSQTPDVGSLRSSPIHIALHAHVDGLDAGESLNSQLAAMLLVTEPVTGEQTSGDFVDDMGAVFPGPHLVAMTGAHPGVTAGALWIWSDHSEPDTSDRSRDWINGWLLTTRLSVHSTVP